MLKQYEIEKVKRDYPPGTRVELTAPMNDPHTKLTTGDKATVDFVDDIGTLHCKFDNGSCLGIIPGEDSFSKIKPDIDVKADFYRYSENHAKDNGSLDKWRESHIANIACARYIDSHETGLEATAYKDNRVDPDNAYCNKVIEKFGLQRTMCVLASTIDMKADDGRISQDNKQWADYHVYQLEKNQTRQYLVDQMHPGVLDIFTKSVRNAYNELGLYNQEHCIPDSQSSLDYEGKVLVVSPESLRESYWQPENQIFLGRSGFGCDPTASGRAVYGEYLYDGEQCRRNRADFIGVMKDEYIPEWVQEKLEQMNQPEQEQVPDNNEGMGMNI